MLSLSLGIALLIGGGCTDQNVYTPPDWSLMDKILADIVEPSFPEYSVDILRFGAKEGEDYDCSESIKRAIDDVSKKGGGTVIIPQGTFYTGPITMVSNIRLHMEEGAELRFSTDPADYLPPVLTRWEGTDCYNYHPLIYAYEAENFAITGKGILNGMADMDHWWPWKGRDEYGFKEWKTLAVDSTSRDRLMQYNHDEVPVEERIFAEESSLRPQFINFYRCKNILLEDFTVVQSPFWLIHPVLCENLTMRRVTTESNGPNNDGCDPDASRNILIEDCFFNTGDDCIAIKSGRNEDGRRWNIPSENIIVRNCTMHNGHGGVVIGSEISGGCRNVFAENCIMNSPELERAIRIKTNSIRGGVVENVFVRNIEVGEVDEAVLRINCHYDKKREGSGDYLPLIRNVHLINVTSKKSDHALFLDGIEGKECIRDIFLIDCEFNGVKEESIVNEVSNLLTINTRVNNEDIGQ